MALQINPYQPYLVKIGLPLAFEQLQVLTQFYQPIVGADGLGLYLTLAHQPQESLGQSYRMMHSRLLPVLNMGVQDFNQARLALEGVGLIRTYRDETSHDDYRRQTLVYVIQMPLAADHFFKHPQLSVALCHQIGEEAYYGLIRLWSQNEAELEQLAEITLPFDQIFKAQDQAQRQENLLDAAEGLAFKAQFPEAEMVSNYFDDKFDLDLFYQILRTDQVDLAVLSQAVLNQVAVLSQYYQLDEQAMAQVVKLATNSVTGQIDLDILQTYARKNQYFSHRQSNEKTEKPAEVQLDQLKEKYPQFSQQELEIIRLCSVIDPTEFLNQLKEEAGGFATGSEHYYLKDLRQRSQLSDSVLNFLVYYLIAMEKFANFEKGRSNRIANEWQQAGIKNPAQALEYLLKERQFKEKQAKIRAEKSATATNKSNWYNKKPKRQEVVPAWLKDRQDKEQTPEPSGQKQDPQIDEAALRQRLNQLLKGGNR